MSNKKKFEEEYKGFSITNTWNSDGYVVITENQKYFETQVSHTVGYRHCGCHNTIEDARISIDKMVLKEDNTVKGIKKA